MLPDLEGIFFVGDRCGELNLFVSERLYVGIDDTSETELDSEALAATGCRF